MMRSLLLTMLTTCALLGGGLRAAQAKTDYQRKIDAAHAAFEVGDYKKAIERFRAAYALERDPRLLYNLALSYAKRYKLHRAGADRIQAEDLFRRFLLLATPKGLPPARRRQLKEVRKLAKEYLAQLGRDKARPATSLPALTPPPASAPASQPTTRTAPKAATSFSTSMPRRSRPRSRWPWALYALAAAGGAAAAITGGLALGAESDAEDLARAGDLAGNHREADAARNYAIATDVLIGVAVTSAVVGIIWHWRVGRR